MCPVGSVSPAESPEVVLVLAAQGREVGLPLEPDVADAGLDEVQVGRHPHRVHLVAVEVERERNADADLITPEKTDGRVQLAGELVGNDVRLARAVRGLGEDRVRLLLVVERQAEAEPLVLGDVGAFDGQEVLRPDRRLEQLRIDAAVLRRHAGLRARGPRRREQDQSEVREDGRCEARVRPSRACHSEEVPRSSISLNASQSPSLRCWIGGLFRTHGEGGAPGSTLRAKRRTPARLTMSIRCTTSPCGTARSAAISAWRSGLRGSSPPM